MKTLINIMCWLVDQFESVFDWIEDAFGLCFALVYALCMGMIFYFVIIISISQLLQVFFQVR